MAAAAPLFLAGEGAVISENCCREGGGGREGGRDTIQNFSNDNYITKKNKQTTNCCFLSPSSNVPNSQDGLMSNLYLKDPSKEKHFSTFLNRDSYMLP